MDGQISNLTFLRKEFTDEWLEVFRHSFLETSQELPKIILILSLICMIGGRCNSFYFSVFCGCILYMSPYRIKEGEGNGTPLQYSCLENPMDRGAWWAAVHGVTMSRTRLSDFTSLFTFMHWRTKWQPTPVFLPGESQGWGSLMGCRLWGRTESDTTEAT